MMRSGWEDQKKLVLSERSQPDKEIKAAKILTKCQCNSKVSIKALPWLLIKPSSMKLDSQKIQAY